jgi:hypothetical protein
VRVSINALYICTFTDTFALCTVEYRYFEGSLNFCSA